MIKLKISKLKSENSKLNDLGEFNENPEGKDKEEEEEVDECSICQGEFIKPYKFYNCECKYCRECIESSLH